MREKKELSPRERIDVARLNMASADAMPANAYRSRGKKRDAFLQAASVALRRSLSLLGDTGLSR